MIWLIATAYLAIGVLAFRWILRRFIREFPDIGNTVLDLMLAALQAAIWPVSVPTLAILTAKFRDLDEEFVHRIAGFKEK